MKKVNLTVMGMHCKSCSMLISDALEDIGVKSSVNLDKNQVIVEFDENKVSLEKIKKEIVSVGYTVK